MRFEVEYDKENGTISIDDYMFFDENNKRATNEVFMKKILNNIAVPKQLVREAIDEEIRNLVHLQEVDSNAMRWIKRLERFKKNVLGLEEKEK